MVLQWCALRSKSQNFIWCRQLWRFVVLRVAFWSVSKIKCSNSRTLNLIRTWTLTHNLLYWIRCIRPFIKKYRHLSNLYRIAPPTRWYLIKLLLIRNELNLLAWLLKNWCLVSLIKLYELLLIHSLSRMKHLPWCVKTLILIILQLFRLLRNWEKYLLSINCLSYFLPTNLYKVMK